MFPFWLVLARLLFGMLTKCLFNLFEVTKKTATKKKKKIIKFDRIVYNVIARRYSLLANTHTSYLIKYIVRGLKIMSVL